MTEHEEPSDREGGEEGTELCGAVSDIALQIAASR